VYKRLAARDRGRQCPCKEVERKPGKKNNVIGLIRNRRKTTPKRKKKKKKKKKGGIFRRGNARGGKYQSLITIGVGKGENYDRTSRKLLRTSHLNEA